MPDLTVMVLCGGSPRHLYVANRLCQSTRVTAIVRETGRRWDSRKLKTALKPQRLWSRGWRWLRDRRRYLGNREAKYFFGDAPPALDHPELSHEVSYINDPEVLSLVERLEPDIIAVYGTSLIRGALLTSARLGMTNLHGGLSPEYRGADCTFWALYNEEPDKIGCTLHYIDPGIDTGDLIAYVKPEVREGDDELTLFWRAVRDGAEVYAEFIQRLAQGEQFGQPQLTKGQLYRVRDRQWRHEKNLAKRLKQGCLNGIELPPRVEWFPRKIAQKTSE